VRDASKEGEIPPLAQTGAPSGAERRPNGGKPMFGKFLLRLRRGHSLDAYGAAKMFDRVDRDLTYKERKPFREVREGKREYASLSPELQSKVESLCKKYLDEITSYDGEEA
jgi:hypothetical protein